MCVGGFSYCSLTATRAFSIVACGVWGALRVLLTVTVSVLPTLTFTRSMQSKGFSPRLVWQLHFRRATLQQRYARTLQTELYVRLAFQ